MSPMNDDVEMTSSMQRLNFDVESDIDNETHRINSNNNNDDADDDEQTTTIPFDIRILDIIESIPDRTIRPGRLATELGISIEDASAELCSLLAIVGGGNNGATFKFEKNVSSNTNTNSLIGTVLTMVFTFPSNFRSIALKKRRRDNLWKSLISFLNVAVKGLKIITAAGLIISLLIVSIAIVAGMIAALIALSRNGGNDRRHNSILTSQIYNIIYTMRQLLWCYALFGPNSMNDEDDNNASSSSTGTRDPFMREVAYDLWLFLSVCFGHPGSIFFWMHANQFHRRNRNHNRRYQGWSTATTTSNELRRDHWNGIMNVPNSSSTEETIYITAESIEHRGLLSVAVEYLFGPTPFMAGPKEVDIWRLRAAIIIEASIKSEGQNVTLKQLAPYISYPPLVDITNTNNSNNAMIVTPTLLIVSFFHGVPIKEETTQNDDVDINEISEIGKLTSKFVFPELLAESVSTSRFYMLPEPDDGTWSSFLYDTEIGSLSSSTTMKRSIPLPLYLKEDRFKFTKLKLQQLLQCIGLGLLNLIGVLWFGQSISDGGILDLTGNILNIPLRRGLYPLLRFYALLFFAIPIGRMILILILNWRRSIRNERRCKLL